MACPSSWIRISRKMPAHSSGLSAKPENTRAPRGALQCIRMGAPRSRPRVKLPFSNIDVAAYSFRSGRPVGGSLAAQIAPRQDDRVHLVLGGVDAQPGVELRA